MRNYESYAALYPLSYYELGTIYSFYGNKTSTGTLATPEQIKKYAPILQELEVDQVGLKENASSYSNCYKDILDRYYAVVVDKVSAGNNSYIVVMLCNKCNGKVDYYTRKYAVDSRCFTDSQNYFPVVAHLNHCEKNCASNGASEKEGKAMKVGGITKAEIDKKVGGITRATNEVNSTSSSVGGITLAYEKKVGGITKA